MRIATPIGIGLGILVGSTCVAFATCDPTSDPDRTDIQNARAAIAAHCDCATAASHGAYLRCAVQQLNLTLNNKGCAGAVKRCASRSTCGRSGVTCCVIRTDGTKCKIKRDAAHCTSSPGGTACVGAYTSCCDACTSTGCATTTTTMCPPTHCGDGVVQPECGERCDGAPGSCALIQPGLACGAPADADACQCCVGPGGVALTGGLAPPCCDGTACQSISANTCACAPYCYPSGASCFGNYPCCSGGDCTGTCP